MSYNILLLAIGRRVQLLQSLKKESDLRIICTDISKTAPAIYFADQYYQVPPITDPEYIPTLLDICQKEKIQLMATGYEGEFFILDQYRHLFEKQGVLLLLSKDKVLEICQDKYQTYRFFQEHGFDTPKTFTPEEVQDRKDLTFPLYLKPRRGAGSLNNFKVRNQEELNFFLNYTTDPIIQEFVEGVEYTMDVFADLNGKPITIVPRERVEVRSGEVSKSRIVKNEQLIHLTLQVTEALGGIGPLTIQCMVTSEGEYKFIEVNPRYGGGLPLSLKAGANYGKFLCQLIDGQPLTPEIGKFEEELWMLRYDQAVFQKGIEVDD